MSSRRRPGPILRAVHRVARCLLQSPRYTKTACGWVPAPRAQLRTRPGRQMICGDSVSNTDTLKNITGTIVLAGAGKMGGAMLSGWLAGGLDPSRVVVVEPYPSDEIRALAQKGVRLNPKDAAAAETLVMA